MPDLNLIALEAEDLDVLSAHLQDAVVRIPDMTFLKRERRFAALLNRFDWEQAASARRAKFARRRSGLRFERVLDAKIMGIDIADADKVLSLLAIVFETKDAPEGYVTLHFSGGSAIRLHVECVEAELKDLGAAWETTKKPAHSDAPSKHET